MVGVTKSMLKLRPHSWSSNMPIFEPATLTAFGQLLLGTAALIAALRGRKPPME
jgi:hypothetical protein